ncbi:MAG: sigma factor-like helix-turn-helix DNA-binding protein [Streptosporangiaceae bacterium]
MAEIVRLRRARVPQAEIARQLGISQQRVSQLYRRALAEVPAGDVIEFRAEELDLIDSATRRLLRLAHDPAVSPRTRVEAWSVLRGWAERRAHIQLHQTENTQVTASHHSRSRNLSQLRICVWQFIDVRRLV